MKIKNYKKYFKKVNIKALSRILLVFILIFSITGPSLAVGKNKAKEEVVYGMLNNDGSVDEIYVVNIFDQQGEIIDYGDYTSVRNMTSEDPIKIDEKQVSINNKEDKLYYEGLLRSKELPWDITMKYFIDNKEYSLEEMAGKSGDLKIEIKIEENKSVDKFFYENYGVQATVLLNTEKVKDIEAEDATMVNVGKDKQLTYTILPGKGGDISIEAQVEDFEMEAISINGINLNLDIQIDDEELLEKVEELVSGVNKLDRASNDLKDGSFKLKEATNKLDKGAEKLQVGASDLDKGAASLKNGTEEINNALELLNKKSSDLTQGSGEFKSALNEIENSLSKVSIEVDKINKLSDSSSQIKTSIGELNHSLKLLNENVGYDSFKNQAKDKGLDIDQLKKGNIKASNELNDMLEKLNEALKLVENYADLEGLESMPEEIKNQIDNISELEELLKGNNAALGGTEVYLDGVSDSIHKIYKGSSDLNESYQEFDHAILELVETLNKMIVKLPELKNAINVLVENYSEFHVGVNSYTDGVGRIVLGYREILDGASSLNSGSSSLKSGNLSFYKNMSQLSKGTEDLYDGTMDLSQATGTFKDKSSNLDEKIQKEIDETLLEITGDASETISFVSDKNKDVKSVQFIMKTNDIKFDKKTDNILPKESKELSFWDKFKDLFTFNI